MGVSVLPRSAEWADVPLEEVEALIAASEREGWRPALARYASEAPFFVRRLSNLSLGNWHVLLTGPAGGRALDVGCGFGSLVLGLGAHFSTVIGVDALPSRLRYAALRARQEGLTGAAFARVNAHRLPFKGGTFDLVTLNGVLEWAALFEPGEPRSLQVSLLGEIRRVLAPSGRVAVAIENRFALESLLTLPDTHTGLTFVTALPRWLADLVSRLRKGEPYHTYLHSRRGCRALLHDAGFRQARILDLVSSYNDYDFVVDTRDRATYRFLWRHGLVRSFFGAAGKIRGALARVGGIALGDLGYAFLAIGGDDVSTILDTGHPVWGAVAAYGVQSGAARFACQSEEPGALVVVTHDRGRTTGLVELRARPGGDDDPPAIAPAILARLGGTARRVGGGRFQGFWMRAFVV